MISQDLKCLRKYLRRIITVMEKLILKTLTALPEQQHQVYQSKKLMHTDEYKDYLFIPFTDATNAMETYEGGRYIDISISGITNNKVIIDFNKAYNPYCCYTTGYN